MLLSMVLKFEWKNRPPPQQNALIVPDGKKNWYTAPSSVQNMHVQSLINICFIFLYTL